MADFWSKPTHTGGDRAVFVFDPVKRSGMWHTAYWLIVYWLLNRLPLPCREDYNCEWIYPYGFVPEGGCPYHD